MPKKNPKNQRKKTGSAPSQQLKVLLALLFLCGFLIVSMVFLSHLRQTLKPEPHPPLKESLNLLDSIQVELESALLRSGITLDRLKIKSGKDVLSFHIQGDFPPTAILESLERRLKNLSAEISLDNRPAEREILISKGNSVCFILQFEQPAAKKPVRKRPRVAIIMDDLGSSVDTARKLLDIDLSVTFSVLPGHKNAPRVAILAHRHAREVLIHIPMEPEGFPKINPGENALFVDLSAREIRHRIQEYLECIPYAVGTNNHMGSRFTKNREKMALVLKEMKKENLFFVDSRTTGHTVAYEEAQKAGVPTTVRDVFLDNVQDVELISKQIDKLAELARQKGHAIGICHPYPQTLKALRIGAITLKKQGIDVVPVSQILPER